MNQTINTYILKSFDTDQNLFLKNTLEFISKAQKLENSVEVIDSLNRKLGKDDFLILYIDDLFTEQIIQNSVNKEFFLNKQYRNNQIILILDDIQSNQLPEYLQYFHTYNVQSNEITSQSDENWNRHDENKTQIFNLLNDIIIHIKRIKSNPSENKLTIYIGPSDDNTTFEYQKITRELLHREFHILPEISNPTAKELIENKEYFINLLESSDLAIHFIGHNTLLGYPEQYSPALKINKFAAEFCETQEGEILQRIVYVPTDYQENNEILSQKILQFKSDTISLKNAELVQTPVEKFKEVILQKLNELGKPLTQKLHIDDTIDDIYLIYPPGLDKEISPYVNWLKKNNIAFSLSQVNLDQLELLQYHQKKLTTCKGVLIFNNGNSQWLNRKLSDIKKSPGWGRKKPFKLKAICNQITKLNEKENNNSFLLFENENKLDSKTFKELLFD